MSRPVHPNFFPVDALCFVPACLLSLQLPRLAQLVASYWCSLSSEAEPSKVRYPGRLPVLGGCGLGRTARGGGSSVVLVHRKRLSGISSELQSKNSSLASFALSLSFGVLFFQRAPILLAYHLRGKLTESPSSSVPYPTQC